MWTIPSCFDMLCSCPKVSSHLSVTPSIALLLRLLGLFDSDVARSTFL
jgi:hypothetical protein